jgi:hypothetical protein
VATRPVNQPKPLPAPNSDFYEFAETLPANELAILKKVRAFMESKVAPIINKLLGRRRFPVRDSARLQGTERRRPRHSGVRLPSWDCPSEPRGPRSLVS